MERECFEDEEVAGLLNEHFVSIKVDREERPDLDSIYMEAIQLLTGTGGWPLTCIALPDGRPIFGGTYIAKPQLMARLSELIAVKENEYSRLTDFAEKVTSGVNNILTSSPSDSTFSLAPHVEDWKKIWDRENGQLKGAPKFPLPSNLNFLLNYGTLCSDPGSLSHLHLTLDLMSRGGIYDQIGGGFCRYSVDEHWDIPHFEKMLYDNAQLIGVYSKAHRSAPSPRYKHIVYSCTEFLLRELTSESGAFYSALDADSEGEEGKFYAFSTEEIESILSPENASFLLDIFDLKTGFFRQLESDEKLGSKLGLSTAEIFAQLRPISETILSHRNSRIRPGLDDKIITSWNALTITGLCSAYSTFSDPFFLNPAKKSLDFLLSNCLTESGELNRIFHSESGNYIEGFLDDYAYLIKACLSMYECTLKKQYLDEARALLFTSLDLFYDDSINGFWFTPNNSQNLFAKKQENIDSVMPSANSVMASNLLSLGRHFSRPDWISMANTMIKTALGNSSHFSNSTNWASVHLQSTLPHYQFTLTGTDHSLLNSAHLELLGKKPPLSSLVGPGHPQATPTDSALSILVCTDGACLLPTTSVLDALEKIS